MSSEDFIAARELAQAEREILQLQLGLRVRLATIRGETINARLDVEVRFGQAEHGAVVNEPLQDLYRELDAIERAARNAVNALHVLTTPAREDAPVE